MENDILNYALGHGILNLEDIQAQIEMTKREKFLKEHPYSVWRGGDNKWHTYLPDKEKGRVSRKRNTEAEIQNLIVEYYTKIEKEEKIQASLEDNEKHHFSTNFRMWEDMQVCYGVSPNTVVKYESDYVRFFLNSEFENMDIRSITDEDISIFIIDRIRKLNLTERAGKALWGYISGVFRSAYTNHRISYNPCSHVDTRKFKKFYCTTPKRKAPRTFTNKEIEDLLRLLYQDHVERPNYIPSYALELAIFTGMRIGELSGLKWSDIHLDLNRIIIKHSEKVNLQTKERTVSETKNRKVREFPLSEDLIVFFGNLKQVQNNYGFNSEYVFSNEDGRIKTHVIANCLRRRCIHLGIPVRGVHALRRTLNSKLRCAGMSPVVAASLLGHTPEVNQQCYTYDVAEFEYKRELVAAVSPAMGSIRQSA